MLALAAALGYLERHARGGPLWDAARARCRFLHARGRCTVFRIAADAHHDGHALVAFEFRPRIARRTAADLHALFRQRGRNPSYDFLQAHAVAPGNVYECTRLRPVAGPCAETEWHFEGLPGPLD